MPKSNSALARELRTVHFSFCELAKSFTRIAPYLTAVPEPAAGAKNATTRHKPRLTAKQRAALKLQGKYMGTMRGLKPANRAKVKKMRAEKGIQAAIKAAERMAG